MVSIIVVALEGGFLLHVSACLSGLVSILALGEEFLLKVLETRVAYILGLVIVVF